MLSDRHYLSPVVNTVISNMKVTALAILALFGALGVALGMGYSGYGGYQYVAAYPAYGASAGGYNDNTFLMLIGFLFLIMILFNGNLFNTNTSNSTTPPGVTVI